MQSISGSYLAQIVIGSLAQNPQIEKNASALLSVQNRFGVLNCQESPQHS